LKTKTVRFFETPGNIPPNTVSKNKGPEISVYLSQSKIQWWLIGTKMSYQFYKSE